MLTAAFKDVLETLSYGNAVCKRHSVLHVRFDTLLPLLLAPFDSVAELELKWPLQELF